MKKNIEWLLDYVEAEYDKAEEKEEDHPLDLYYTGKRKALREVFGKINQLDEPEVLSSDWIERNTSPVDDEGRLYVWKRDLQNVLVPNQEEVDQAYKDSYEKGKQHATEKQSEETETVARVLLDYLIASAKLKLVLSMEVEELEE